MRKVIQNSIIGLLAFLLGCESKPINESVSPEKDGLRFPIIIDTSGFQASKREGSWLSIANYELLYIGKWIDTIYADYDLKYYPILPPPPPPTGGEFKSSDTIGYHKKLTEHKMYSYFVDWSDSINFKPWYEAKISITVDTSQRVKKDYIHLDSPYFEAYPVLLENKDIDTIAIGYGQFLPLITEAKDSSGNWKPIEEKYIRLGIGGGIIILPPNEIGLSATMIYHGNYLTMLRLRLVNNVSNEFKGTINYRQFESMLNEHGDYKEEYKKEIKKNDSN